MSLSLAGQLSPTIASHYVRTYYCNKAVLAEQILLWCEILIL